VRINGIFGGLKKNRPFSICLVYRKKAQ